MIWVKPDARFLCAIRCYSPGSSLLKHLALRLTSWLLLYLRLLRERLLLHVHSLLTRLLLCLHLQRERPLLCACLLLDICLLLLNGLLYGSATFCTERGFGSEFSFAIGTMSLLGNQRFSTERTV